MRTHRPLCMHVLQGCHMASQQTLSKLLQAPDASRLSCRVTGKREKQEGIGSVKINIKDVVRNRRLKDSWALQVSSSHACLPAAQPITSQPALC